MVQCPTAPYCGFGPGGASHQQVSNPPPLNSVSARTSMRQVARARALLDYGFNPAG